MTGICSHCGSELPPDLQIEFDDDGLPIRGAVREGWGLPQFMMRGSFFVMLDGAKVDHCLGFDRRAGFVVRIQTDPQGRPIREPDSKTWRAEKAVGSVTLVPRGETA